MSRQLPALKPRQVIRALERVGFEVRRIRGSHYQLVHSSNPALDHVPYGHPRHQAPVAACHSHMGTRDIKRRLLHAILKDCGLSVDVFLYLLR